MEVVKHSDFAPFFAHYNLLNSLVLNWVNDPIGVIFPDVGIFHQLL